MSIINLFKCQNLYINKEIFIILSVPDFGFVQVFFPIQLIFTTSALVQRRIRLPRQGTLEEMSEEMVRQRYPFSRRGIANLTALLEPYIHVHHR